MQLVSWCLNMLAKIMRYVVIHETENAVIDNHYNHQLDKSKKEERRTIKAECVWYLDLHQSEDIMLFCHPFTDHLTHTHIQHLVTSYLLLSTRNCLHKC